MNIVGVLKVYTKLVVMNSLYNLHFELLFIFACAKRFEPQTSTHDLFYIDIRFNPFQHSTILQQTTLKTSQQYMTNDSVNIDQKWKHWGKWRNCSLWSFFFKCLPQSFQKSEVSESVCRRVRVWAHRRRYYTQS